MPRQPRSSRLRRGSGRVDHTSSHRHPCANGHRLSMAMSPSCSINPRGVPHLPRLGPVCLRLIVLRRFTMTTSNEKSYFDLHITGLGYLSRIREVKPKKGDSFLACDIAALNGPS